MTAKKAFYRPDIDGLRAVAVLLVVCYHAGINIPGGFIGVDVFFVISGFLISGIVVREVRNGRFSFANFYSRRIKRLIPAFIVVAIGSIIMIRSFYLPDDYEAFTKSLQNALLGISNIYFWKVTQGYFASDASMLPLIHTWSLSVEEQFYLIWPVLIIGLFTFTRFLNPKITLSLLFISLLILSEWMARHAPHAAYYLLPARAFELMMGGLLAVSLPFLPRLTPALANLLSVAGLALIFTSATLINGHSYFPGLNAFWPCLGAILFIWSGTGATPGWGNRIVSIKPIVLIGLISYSVYLWHWPPIALAHYLNIELSLPVSCIIIAGSLFLGWLTWKYVERPTRKINWSFAPTFAFMFVIPVLLVVGGYKFIRVTDGNPDRLNPQIQDLVQHAKDDFAAEIFSDCFNTEEKFERRSNCLFGDTRKKTPDFLLLGDSHANAAHGFFDVLAKDAALTGLEVTASGGPFLVGSERYLYDEKTENFTASPELSIRNEAIKAYIDDDFRGFVVLAGRWPMYLNDLDVTFKPDFTTAFDKTLEFLQEQNITAYIFLTVPEYEDDLSLRCQAIQFIEGPLMNTDHNCSKGNSVTALDHFTERQKTVTKMMDDIAQRYKNIIFIDPKNVLCSAEGCSTTIDNHVIYNDSNHLNYSGSTQLGEQYLEQLGNPLKQHKRNITISDIWR